MSFWSSFAFHTESNIDKLLKNPDCSLEELFEDNELIQECRSQNHTLIEL